MLRFILMVFGDGFNVLLVGAVAAVVLCGAVWSELPSPEHLREVRLHEPLRIYSSQGKLLAEIGEKHRRPVRFDEVPDPLLKAFLAAEDDRFFSHIGVDYRGILRAVFSLVTTGKKRQGGSTITMQVAKNFFLSPERSFQRKFAEILLSLQIERTLNKAEIFELYLNKIFLGHRAYGVVAASQLYYGKALAQLSLAEIAMIAGLPKAPSASNPVINPSNALERRNYVLRRMRKLGFIEPLAYSEAYEIPVHAKIHRVKTEVEAPHIAELVRAEMVKRFGKQAAYTRGYHVTTTLNQDLQTAAKNALRNALLAYDRRHGYRGVEGHLSLQGKTAEDWPELFAQARVKGKKLRDIGGLLPALVVSVEKKKAQVYLPNMPLQTLALADMRWARRYRSVNRRGATPKKISTLFAVGDLIRVRKDTKKGWVLAQLPKVEGAFVSLRPQDGAILALVGGFDYRKSKFNRAVASKRQPGSNIKPFFYSAALEKGLTPASILKDKPIAIKDGSGKLWRPKNYSHKYSGPIRMRIALSKSKNLATIDLVRTIGVDYARDYAKRFGFDDAALPKGLSVALGSGVVSPLELAAAYAVFANGGYRVRPHLIAKVTTVDGTVVFEQADAVDCVKCPGQEQAASSPATRQHAPAARVTNERNVYQVTSMLRDVIQRGTAVRAKVLGRRDIAGKTGTTNDQRDAWFSGFHKDIVASAWVGFDRTSTLGAKETGGRAALPVWIEFMKVALADKPKGEFPEPAGMMRVRINPRTGHLATKDTVGAIYETIREEYWDSLAVKDPVPVDEDFDDLDGFVGEGDFEGYEDEEIRRPTFRRDEPYRDDGWGGRGGSGYGSDRRAADDFSGEDLF